MKHIMSCIYLIIAVKDETRPKLNNNNFYWRVGTVNDPYKEKSLEKTASSS